MPSALRRLAAIMYTDIMGYTPLGQRNESLSLALVKEQRRLIRPILARHQGREVKTMGDAFLVEFSSAVEAVRCAYDIQRAIRDFNLSLAEDRRINLRIGIHLGEVVEDRRDILGDAVNVASRIEKLSEDGGVCLTSAVHDDVQGKVDFQFVSMGERALKGISKEMQIFKVAMPWDDQQVEPRRGPDSKRVAVLPLANMSPDPNDEYFAEGLTEEVINMLSKIRELSVISRTSVMQFKENPKPIPDISRELNAGTILEGSVRKVGTRARISIEMIDATEDKHLWADNYDRDLRDIFAVQSEIAEKVAEALKLELLQEEKDALGEAPTKSVEANLLVLRGIYEMDKGSPSNMLKAIDYFSQAIERDNAFAFAYSMRGGCYITIIGEAMSGADAFPKAREDLEWALKLDPKSASAHSQRGWLSFQCEWDWEGAEKSLKRSIDLTPNSAQSHYFYGRVLASLGRFDEAIVEGTKAYELAPASAWAMDQLGYIYYIAGRYKEAEETFNMLLKKNPTFVRGVMGLAFALAAQGKVDEAIAEADEAVVVDETAVFQAQRALVHAAVGSAGKCKEIFDDILAKKYEGYISPAFIGALHYSLGDEKSGYECMKKAFAEQDPAIPWCSKWACMNSARKDARYSEMLRQIGLS